ncbi:hypothetical protein QT999_24820, partial [Microcoleus sp. S36b_A2]
MWFLISFPIASELYILILDSGSVPASEVDRSSGTIALYRACWISAERLHGAVIRSRDREFSAR